MSDLEPVGSDDTGACGKCRIYRPVAKPDPSACDVVLELINRELLFLDHHLDQISD